MQEKSELAATMEHTPRLENGQGEHEQGSLFEEPEGSLNTQGGGLLSSRFGEAFSREAGWDTLGE